jgi:hypothetical protein
MRKIVLFLFILVAIGVGIYYWQDSQTPKGEEGSVCTQEVFQCPDGSYVSREGKECKFKACPEAAKPELGEIELGNSQFINGVRIRLNKIVSDSRCPVDVQCIQAGALTVSITLQSDTDKETRDISSDEAIQFDSHTISIENIEPANMAGVTLEPESYLITFRVHAL